MRAWIGFECEGCGLLLDPTFEVARVDCVVCREEEVWVCLSCGSKRGGVPCGRCRPAWRAKQEAKREAAEEKRRLAEKKRFAARPMDPML